MLRYYFDEHVKSAISDGLHLKAIDVLTAQQAGLSNLNISDVEQLAHATRLGRVLVTEDRDFVTLAFTHQPHPGIILLQRPLSIGQYVDYLELMALTTDAEDIANQLIYCDW